MGVRKDGRLGFIKVAAAKPTDYPELIEEPHGARTVARLQRRRCLVPAVLARVINLDLRAGDAAGFEAADYMIWLCSAATATPTRGVGIGAS